MATLTAAQAQEAIEPTAAEELTGTPALEITEKLTAAQALEEIESTAAEELTDAQAVALADDLAYPELTEAQENELFADDEPKQPLPPPSPPLYDFRPEALAPVARQALAAVRAAGVEWDDDAEVDHACWRVETAKAYELASCAALQDGAELLGEAMVGGRPVSVFRLREPLDVGTHRIRLLELPAPKKGSAYATGWEHIEVALGSDEKLEALAAQLRATSALKVNWRNWTRASNREVRVTPPGMNFRVAFHARPLDQVLADERKDGSFVEVPDDYWEPQLDADRAAEAAALARYENLLRQARLVPAGDGSLERLLASGPALARLDGSDEAIDFDPAELRPAPFPGEEFDARLETRFAGLSAKVG